MPQPSFETGRVASAVSIPTVSSTAADPLQEAQRNPNDDAAFHSSSDAIPETLSMGDINTNASLAFLSAQDLLIESERLRGDL